MVKVNAPAMSLSASGSLGGALVFSTWKGRPYVRTLVKPSNPKSGLQVGMRSMFKFLSQEWAGLSTAEQATWETLADQIVASPFNAYMKLNQANWRNFLAPSWEDPPARALATSVLDTAPAATAGTRQISITFRTPGGGNNNWGLLIFRGATGFATAPSNLIAVVNGEGISIEKTFVDTPLDPGAYFYNTRSFTTDGTLGAELGEITATVV